MYIPIHLTALNVTLIIVLRLSDKNFNAFLSSLEAPVDLFVFKIYSSHLLANILKCESNEVNCSFTKSSKAPELPLIASAFLSIRSVFSARITPSEDASDPNKPVANSNSSNSEILFFLASFNSSKAPLSVFPLDASFCWAVPNKRPALCALIPLSASKPIKDPVYAKSLFKVFEIGAKY